MYPVGFPKLPGQSGQRLLNAMGASMPKETLIGLEDQLAQAQRELDELRAQRNATDAVLQVINRSTFDLQNVFDTLVESAARLCEADSAHIYRRQSADYRLAAACGFSGEYREYISRIRLAPSRNTLVGRTALERQVVHIPDALEDPEYTWGEAQRLGGFRTMLGVKPLPTRR
jgi:signal transduction protein with GAF and PtsI domain